jgi:thiamine biosynthesis lipoprotein ApbE
LQVSIMGRRATDTDALATATSVLGVERGLALVESRPDMAALFIRKSGMEFKVSCSKRLDSYLQKNSKPNLLHNATTD